MYELIKLVKSLLDETGLSYESTSDALVGVLVDNGFDVETAKRFVERFVSKVGLVVVPTFTYFNWNFDGYDYEDFLDEYAVVLTEAGRHALYRKLKSSSNKAAFELLSRLGETYDYGNIVLSVDGSGGAAKVTGFYVLSTLWLFGDIDVNGSGFSALHLSPVGLEEQDVRYFFEAVGRFLMLTVFNVGVDEVLGVLFREFPAVRFEVDGDEA